MASPTGTGCGWRGRVSCWFVRRWQTPNGRDGMAAIGPIVARNADTTYTMPSNGGSLRSNASWEFTTTRIVPVKRRIRLALWFAFYLVVYIKLKSEFKSEFKFLNSNIILTLQISNNFLGNQQMDVRQVVKFLRRSASSNLIVLNQDTYWVDVLTF